MPDIEETEEVQESTEEPAEEESEETAEAPAPEEAAESAPETPEPVPQKPANEMKVVIVVRDDKIMLGVQSPDCDPVYTTMTGTLAMALKKVSALVTKAKQKWQANPKYPKADLPAPPPTPVPARTPSSSTSSKPKVQPSFF